jgi:hypothetical protein
MADANMRLPLSIDTLSWRNVKPLTLTLSSDKQNGLYHVIDKFSVFLQWTTDADRSLAAGIGTFGFEEREHVGIGRASTEITQRDKQRIAVCSSVFGA